MGEESNNIKIVVEAYGEKATFEFSDEIDIGELIDKFILIAHFLTFSHETIQEYLSPGGEEGLPEREK